MAREWIEHPLYKGCFLSDEGDVWANGKELRPFVMNGGRYRAVHLPNSIVKNHFVYVHHLVCETFNGERPKGMVVSHKDCDSHNNRADNVKWATQHENIHNGIANGRHSSGEEHGEAIIAGQIRNNTQWLREGENNGHSKITANDVIYIRNLYDAGDADFGELAEQYGVTGACIKQAATRVTWKHI